MNQERLHRVLERARAALDTEDYELLKGVVETLAYLTRVAEDRQTTIKELRRLLFGSKTEKTRDVLILLEQIEDEETARADKESSTDTVSGAGPGSSAADAGTETDKKTKRKGHGRNGADAYTGAKRVRVAHGSLKHGDRCPECGRGNVYDQKNEPETLVRIVGQAPVQATLYDLQRLRCNACQQVFTADTPDGVGPDKYDATAGAMVGLLKYGAGVPFHRQEKLQQSLGIPLPASTQWEIVEDVAKKIAPAYAELIRQAAQGEVLHNDDTGIKILALNGREPAVKDKQSGKKPERTGVFTSGIVSTREGRKIAVFFTGRKHAGENLADVLSQRASSLGPPIQMCDGLARNLPSELKVILGNCLAHGRRQFIDVGESFPAECRYVLERLAEVYKNDEIARERALSPEERLSFHKAQSGPIMDELQEWLNGQLFGGIVEPNSGLGRAIAYFLRRWDALTLFLRQAGAPLDNNICERALKKVILHRKNALFFKTQNGAAVADLFMSLIHTAELCGANPFDYLTELQRHAEELVQNPEDWMPWNYRQTLEGISASAQTPG